MTPLGDWLKRVDSAKAAVGFIILVVSLIATVTTSVWTNIGIPTRVQALEVIVREHITKEEKSTERIYCVVKEVFDYMVDEEKGPINPLACEPEGGEDA